MGDKTKGLYPKYEITRIDKPEKRVDHAIVLEFKDKIARKAIKAWAIEMIKEGYEKAGIETLHKLWRDYNE